MAKRKTKKKAPKKRTAKRKPAKRKTKKKATKKRAKKKATKKRAKKKVAKRKPAKPPKEKMTPAERLEFARKALHMGSRMLNVGDIDGGVDMLMNAFHQARMALKATQSKEAYNLAYDAEKAIRERLLHLTRETRNPQTRPEKRKRRERLDSKAILRSAMRGT